MLGLRFLALGKNFSSQIQIALPGWYSVSSRPHWPVLLRPVTFLLQCPEAAFSDRQPGLLAVATGACSQAHTDTLLRFQKFCEQIVASL